MIKSSRIRDLLGSLSAVGEPIRASGLSAGARALTLAHLALRQQSRVIAICADDETSSTLANDIETLSSSLAGKKVRAWSLPGWDRSPYSSIAPSIRTRLDRIAALHAVSTEKGAAVISVSLPAIIQATLPPKELERYTLGLQVGNSVESREALLTRLREAGYMIVDPVEDPGSACARGEIIDVFPPGAALPLRIELFGDEIERIRVYDPKTQRTSTGATADFNKIEIPPAREVLINQQTAPRLRERLKTFADDAGIPRSVRDPVLHSIHEGIYPDHCDAWAPFAYESPGNAWDYFRDSTIVFIDELGAMQVLDAHMQELKKTAAEDSKDAGIILPPPCDLFSWTPELDREVRAKTKLYLDQLELAQLEAKEEGEDSPTSPDEIKVTARHRFVVNPNSDLVHAGKNLIEQLESKFQLWLKQGFKIVCFASTQSQLERIRYLLEERGLIVRINGPAERGLINLIMGSIHEGFRWPSEGWVVLTESDLLGHRRPSRQRKEEGDSPRNWAGLQALSDLSVGDAVVHVDHGIGRYHGLVRLDLSGAPSDFLLLEYANKDKLYLPVYRLNVIQKYAGAGADIALDKLGSQQFAKTKEKVKTAVRKLAIDLVSLYAERKVRKGATFSGRDAEFQEFEGHFPFEETRDQLKAIDSIIEDLGTGKVMDRLVCGDVGYGKTEVAMRAAFRVASEGKQVAVLVPTTILAHQHEQSFKTRFKDYPFKISSVSRFKSAKEQRAVLEETAQGKVDILVGTHRLLSRDVTFKDLGLIIVDEEHRFGVEHKEKLKTLKTNTHVLTLTATPIPRTLHMALSGLRDISLITTAPVDRLPIRTYVSKYDEAMIKKAVELELNRGGQVFFVHNRVDSIFEISNRLRALVPQASIGVAHGQMSETELEDAMVAFYQRNTNLLVCTSIIESGLDLPSANTIIVNRADMFGLAQLYQIRGRVGRGQTRAYCYLLLPSEGAVTEDAKKRLEVLQRFVELGAGFSIASHDLEIRGGGDLLGANQSGHINAVGFDLYTELLEEAIRELEGKELEPEQLAKEPEIKAPFAAYLDESYVPDVHQRLSLYRRLSASSSEPELTDLETELRDRFGEPPVETYNLLWLIRIKQLLKRAGVETLTVGNSKITMLPGEHSRVDPARLVGIISAEPKKFQLTPDSKIVAVATTARLQDLVFDLESLFKRLIPGF